MIESEPQNMLNSMMTLIIFTTFQVLNFHPDDPNTGNGEKGQAQHFHGKCLASDKAISLPSSPHRTYGRGNAAGIFGSPDMMSRLEKVIESSRILNKPLLPFDEWNIDFSEITIGARVGIGIRYSFTLQYDN